VHAVVVKTWRGNRSDCLEMLSPNFIFTGSSDGGLFPGKTKQLGVSGQVQAEYGIQPS